MKEMKVLFVGFKEMSMEDRAKIMLSEEYIKRTALWLNDIFTGLRK